MTSTLKKHFPAACADSEFERELLALRAGAKERWPGLEVPDDAFFAAVARAMAGRSERETLAVLRAGDLYLAAGCAVGVEGALSAFEERVLPQVARTLERLVPQPDERDEVLQRLRSKLLLGQEGAAPGIAGYAGRGPLVGFVRATAVNTTLNLRKVEKDHLPIEDQLSQLPPVREDPELSAIRKEHRAEFRAALASAFQRLTSQERNILRMYLLEGLSLDRVGQTYRVHASTISRWVARIRLQLVEHTRTQLAERLGLTPTELESIMAVARGTMDLTISRLLRTAGE